MKLSEVGKTVHATLTGNAQFTSTDEHLTTLRDEIYKLRKRCATLEDKPHCDHCGSIEEPNVERGLDICPECGTETVVWLTQKKLFKVDPGALD